MKKILNWSVMMRMGSQMVPPQKLCQMCSRTIMLRPVLQLGIVMQSLLRLPLQSKTSSKPLLMLGQILQKRERKRRINKLQRRQKKLQSRLSRHLRKLRKLQASQHLLHWKIFFSTKKKKKL
jgi:hypothetical protein